MPEFCYIKRNYQFYNVLFHCIFKNRIRFRYHFQLKPESVKGLKSDTDYPKPLRNT